MSHSGWRQFSDRALPAWYDDAKLGIFFHWGPYSVPRWAPRVSNIQELLQRHGPRAMLRLNPYSEWYLNTMSLPRTPTWRHHRETYGSDYPYEAFAAEFSDAAESANIDEMAELVEAAGAGYAVLTTKHHDGYTLWPSRQAHPVQGRYGSHRDLVGDFDTALRGRGLRTGLYYSGGYDWPFNAARMSGPADSILAIPTDPAYAAYAEDHVRELIERYRPSVLWNDIGWPEATDLPALFASYYESVPDGVINDRWAQHRVPNRPVPIALTRLAGHISQALWKFLPAKQRELAFPSAKHADFTTPEYASYDEIVAKKWESTRGVGLSFAANRNEEPSDIVTAEELIWFLVDTVSKNGNLLIGVGPLPDGTISPEQQAPLRDLGAWLQRSGAAIRGSRPWHRAEAEAADGTDVRVTRAGEEIHLISRGAPNRKDWELTSLEAAGEVRATLVETGEEIEVGSASGPLTLMLPDRLPVSPAHVFRLSGNVRPRRSVVSHA